MNTIVTGATALLGRLAMGAGDWSRALNRVRAADILRTCVLTAAALILFGLAGYAEATTAAGTSSPTQSGASGSVLFRVTLQ
jgi:hypothetical protein